MTRENERTGLSRVMPQSASVMVQPEGVRALPRQRILAIQELIFVVRMQGMATDDVVVIDTNSTTQSARVPMARILLLTKQREAEKHIEYKLRKLLVEYPAQIAVLLRLIRPWNLNLPL